MSGMGMSGDTGGVTRDSIGGPANYYNTTMEPMQMLHALRAGQPVVNHIYRQPGQFLPPSLPTTPQQAPAQSPTAPAIAQAPVTGWQPAATPAIGNDGSWWAGPGGDGSPGGVGTDSGADGSGGGGGK